MSNTGQSTRQRNVNHTIFKRVDDVLDTGAAFSGVYTGHVFYQDALADPSAQDAQKTALRYWLELCVLSGGAGLKLPTLVQCDAYYLVGDESTTSSSDRYGSKVAGILDDLQTVWGHNGFPVYDFSSTPSTPTVTDQWLLVQNSRGARGWPEEAQRVILLDDWAWRATATYQIWLQEDLRSSQIYHP